MSVIHPKPGAVKDEVVLPGNVQAFTDSPIYARSSGYLKKWFVDIGGHVKAGQELAIIEAPELDQQVRQAKATIQQAQAALDQAIANEQQGKANEELARVNADRWKNLVAKGAVSRQENDQYQAQYQAQVANLNALEQAIAAARSNIAADQANLGRLQEMQSYEIVRAPFDGIVTARNIDIGALINAGNGGPAQELFHMASTAKLRVYVNVPQADSRAAVPGIKCYLTLTEFPGRKFPGELVRTAGARSIPPAERCSPKWMSIMLPASFVQAPMPKCTCMIPEGSRSLILPVSTLLFRSEGLRVGVVRDGNKAELVPVVLGKDYGNEVEVVSGHRRGRPGDCQSARFAGERRDRSSGPAGSVIVFNKEPRAGTRPSVRCRAQPTSASWAATTRRPLARHQRNSSALRRRHQNSGTPETLGRRDDRLQIRSWSPRRHGRKTRAPLAYPVMRPVAFDHTCRALLDRIGEFSAPMVAVDAHRELVARFQIGWLRCAHRKSLVRFLDSRALHHRQWLANVEAQRGVKRKRSIVKRGLNQSHAGEVALARAIQHGFHQLAPDAAILHLRIDRDRAHARDGIAFVQAIASGDARRPLRPPRSRNPDGRTLGSSVPRPQPASGTSGGKL